MLCKFYPNRKKKKKNKTRDITGFLQNLQWKLETEPYGSRPSLMTAPGQVMAQATQLGNNRARRQTRLPVSQPRVLSVRELASCLRIRAQPSCLHMSQKQTPATFKTKCFPFKTLFVCSSGPMLPINRTRVSISPPANASTGGLVIICLSFMIYIKWKNHLVITLL